MPNLTAEDTHRDDELLGMWEEGWHVRALHVQKIERYRAWLRHHGASRDEAAVRTVRSITGSGEPVEVPWLSTYFLSWHARQASLMACTRGGSTHARTAIEAVPTDFTQSSPPETRWSFPWESSGGTHMSYVVRSIRGIVKHNEVLLLDQQAVRLITLFGHEEWQTGGIRVSLPQHYELQMDASRSDGGNYLVGTRVLAACLGNQVVGLRSV